jgi:hypothetical protein
MAVDRQSDYNSRNEQGPNAVTDQTGADTVWRAALEQQPPDSRGFRRTLRLHAVAFQQARPAPQAICGYRHQPGELRPERFWKTVTVSGRCTLCELRLRRATEDGVDVTESVDLVERDQPGARPRLSVVSEDDEPTGLPERRSPDRP